MKKDQIPSSPIWTENEYTIRAWYGETMVSCVVVAVDQDSAKADVISAYGNFDFCQVSL